MPELLQIPMVKHQLGRSGQVVEAKPNLRLSEMRTNLGGSAGRAESVLSMRWPGQQKKGVRVERSGLRYL